jgi:hypothetical protein
VKTSRGSHAIFLFFIEDNSTVNALYMTYNEMTCYTVLKHNPEYEMMRFRLKCTIWLNLYLPYHGRTYLFDSKMVDIFKMASLSVRHSALIQSIFQIVLVVMTIPRKNVKNH